MKFGPVPVGEAEGAILAHSVKHDGGVIKKGTVLAAPHVAILRGGGVAEVVVARLEPGDVQEDAAAERIAKAIAGKNVRVDPPFTGRSNLYAEAAGVLVVERAAIDRLNRIDPAITVATLPEFATVEAGRMVATVKMIPFAIAGGKVELALANSGTVQVSPFRPFRVGLVQSALPSLKQSVLDKTRRLLEERLAPAGARLTRELRIEHNAWEVGEALAELRQGADILVVFGASATVDEADVVPAGIVRAGGTVTHFGMPVDPGNLLVLGELGGVAVIGAPGCARSPKENGFDWVLNRLLAGLRVEPEDVTSLGVGGLLMEIVSRPQPREPKAKPGARPSRPTVAALILAAGQSRRMGGPNKLMATIGGKPLIRIAAEEATKSKAVSVAVVTGHHPDEAEAALAGLSVKLVHNPDYAAGLSTSLRAGLASLPKDIDGVIVLLADMPGVTAAMIDRLIESFDPDQGALIVVPTFDGKRGNPVLWSSRFFDDLQAVKGDTGGRHLIGTNLEAVVEVEIGRAVALDIDTPAELAEAGGRPAEA